VRKKWKFSWHFAYAILSAKLKIQLGNQANRIRHAQIVLESHISTIYHTLLLYKSITDLLWRFCTASCKWYTSRMSPASEKRCCSSCSRCRTRRVSLRSWARSTSTSSWTDDDGDDGVNRLWCGDGVSLPVPSDSRSPGPDPGVSPGADEASMPLEVAGFQTDSSLCRCPVSPSTAPFYHRTTATPMSYFRDS